MKITEDQYIELIATLAMVEATGSINGQPTLGMVGAQGVFLVLQDFVTQLEKKNGSQ